MVKSAALLLTIAGLAAAQEERSQAPLAQVGREIPSCTTPAHRSPCRPSSRPRGPAVTES